MRQRAGFFTLSVSMSAIALLLFLSTAPTWGQSAPGNEEAIAQRQKIMKSNGDNVRELRDKEKNSKITEIAVNNIKKE